MKITLVKKNLLVNLAAIMTLAIAVPCFAESAPVFDADTMQQVAEGGDQGEFPMPPAPGQENAFVPMQAQESPNIMPQSPMAAPQSPAFDSPGPMAASSGSRDDQRIKRLEQQLSNIQSSNSSTRIEALQKEVQSLRGQVEQQNHELDQLRNQQKSMYSDLDKRLVMDNSKDNSRDISKDISKKLDFKKFAKAATESPANTIKSKSVQNSQPDVAEEQQIYQTAYNLIKAKKYDEAVQALQKMLVKYPSGQFASNAHYWLGELFGLMGKNDQALSEFTIVVKNYPQSPRIADAQLKIGLIHATKFNWSEAKASFKKVVNQYPGTASARLALEQLRQIKQAGH